MLEKLITIFPSLVKESDVPPSERHLYLFFKVNDQETAAIKKEEISEKERKVLEVFLDHKTKEASFDPIEKGWYSYLKEDGSPPPQLQELTSFRFYHLEGNKLYDNKSDVLEALRHYFDMECKCIFLHTHSLLVIVRERKEDPLPAFNAEELAGIIAADLLLDVKVYSGRRVHAADNVRYIFEQEKMLFEHALHLFPKERAFKDFDMMPFIFPSLKKKEQQQVFSYALGELEQEKELLNTLYYFYLSNLNISLTAKELHMHRNTLQYRLDKVIEHIGIDIKQFPNAAALYVMLRNQWQ
ncbi:PucR family transcriptional regulator [Alteribacillus sp. JSM 102045]|uniref:PucR family transcriptional regulator n=1 Tax=Alteribacillus sp. JSM 102045 TaxID=1562101 RepID=UPI0035C000B9